MTIWIGIFIGLCVGIVLTILFLNSTRHATLRTQYEKQILELELQHQTALAQAKKNSVNTSRAVLKGKMAEQLAPILPTFPYLPSDAKFLGDPIDYVIFKGYSDFKDNQGAAEQIEIIFVDIKTGRARLNKGQQAIAKAIENGRVRFETIRIQLD